MQNVLESVSEGMKVFDSENHEIGKVDYVKLVETDGDRPNRCRLMSTLSTITTTA